MTRIAYISTDPGIAVFGNKGASIHIQEMLRAFLASGAEITIVSPRLEGPVPQEFASIIRLPLAGITGEPLVRARRALDSNDTLVKALAHAGSFDLIYERHALFAHGAMEYARRHAISSVLEVNAPLLEEQARHRVLALPAEAKKSTQRAFTAAGAIVAVSPEVARYAETMNGEPARIHVIPNAVNPSRFPLRASPNGTFTVGFLGALRPWHDLATLVDAFAILRSEYNPAARLLIVGDGPERSTVESRLARHRLHHAAEFTGAIAPDQVGQQLARMHVAVAPYAGKKPFYFSPLKLYEYMAARLPVVVSRVGHLAEIIDDGRTALFCPPDDSTALAAMLGRLANAPALRQRLGAAARAEVLARHTWDQVAARVFTLAGIDNAPAWQQAS